MFGVGRRLRDPVPGLARVVSCTHAPHATHGSVRMTLVVEAEGMAPYSTEHSCMCRVDRWPSPGESLPVEVERADPQRLRVDWDQVATHRERAHAEADRMARAMGGHGTLGTDPGTAGPVEGAQVHHVVINLSDGTTGTGDMSQVADALRMAEAMTGMDLDGDGRVGGPAAQAPPAPEGGGDRLKRLERLARLREEGVLTAEEFAAEKARILGGP